jgi:hypothetical protein
MPKRDKKSLKTDLKKTVAECNMWTVRGSIPGGSKILDTCLHRHWIPPNLLCNGYRVYFPGIKLGHDVNHLSHLVPTLKKE